MSFTWSTIAHVLFGIGIAVMVLNVSWLAHGFTPRACIIMMCMMWLTIGMIMGLELPRPHYHDEDKEAEWQKYRNPRWTPKW